MSAIVPPPAASDEATREPDADRAPLVDVSAWARESPPWLASMVLHMLVVLLLGLWLISTQEDQPFELEAQYAEDVGEQLIDEPLDLDMPAELEEQALAPTPLPPVEDPLAMPELAPVAPRPQISAASTPSINVGTPLSGREPGMKQALLKAYGGTASTEQAVLLGLRWLKRNQRSDGSWSLMGPYEGKGGRENQEAATAMALIAFQGAGYTHQEADNSEFTECVAQGRSFLLRRQRDSGTFFRKGDVNHPFYTHALGTIALCELYGMTQDEDLRIPAQRAVDFCVRSQSENGGWRYVYGQGGDLSVTGWVLMGLQSARMAGLDVPSECLFRVGEFLDSVSRKNGSRYSYMPRDMDRLSMTAEGLLCRQYLGWKHDDKRLVRGVRYLLDHLPRWTRGNKDEDYLPENRNAYYWYYGTQVCHHMGGEYWKQWNEVMRQLVPEHQVKAGRERGSWDPQADKTHGGAGGRLYTTCLSLYMLEVYYRHLPIYQEGLLSSY